MQELLRKLCAEFDPKEIKWKPAVVSGNRCLALPYIDARAIMDRLDAVVGVAGWRDSYRLLDDGCVVCKLSIKLEEVWVAKVDVGSPSDQGDSGDRRKAAFSDALKRAGVKFGIGRYLYSLPSQWVDYDPAKKRIVRMPTLPGKPSSRIPAIHAALKRSNRTWKQALTHFGVTLPADFTEPETPEDAAKQLRDLVPSSVIESLERMFHKGESHV